MISVVIAMDLRGDLEEGRGWEEGRVGREEERVMGWEEGRVMGWPPAMDRGWGVGGLRTGWEGPQPCGAG